MIFRDRMHAGRLLGEKLAEFAHGKCVVLALPRGGVPVAREVARSLDSPLEVLLVRKIGAPRHEELALGAICENDEPVWNHRVLTQLGLVPNDLNETVRKERARIVRQRNLFRGGRDFPSVESKTVIVVDDGLATGATMKAALRYLKGRGAARVIAAVPVAASSSVHWLKKEADEVVAISEREDLTSVGEWYDDFSQTTDDEVLGCLERRPEVR